MVELRIAADYVRPNLPLSSGDIILKKERAFWKKAVVLIALVMCATFLLALLSGRYNCTKFEVFMAFLYGILDGIIWVLELPTMIIPGLSYEITNPIPVTWSQNVSLVVWGLRMVRIVAVIFIGGALAMAGASYQAMFRNPLVSESILGVSNGACFGACIAMLFAFGSVAVNVFAFAGGVCAVFITYFASTFLRGNRTLLLILTGTVVSSLFSAGISIIKYVAPTDTVLPEITFWMMGSFAKITSSDLFYLIPIIVVCAAILVRHRWKMNLLSLGDNEAKSLGVDVSRSRGIVITCATLLVSVSVCVCGNISWVGIIIPQIVRFLVGPDCRRLMPCAFFVGGIFMMLVDVACRSLATSELPVSVITSLIGAPMFFIILKQSKTGWA